ncbi:MAG: hypothetical protein ACI4VW_06310 [Acutalibacteraceae bacterium]
MKRIIAMVISVVAIFSVNATTVFAAETEIIKSVELSAHAYSTFTVTIPEQVDLSATNGSVDISVDAINLEPGYQLGFFTNNSGSVVQMKRSDDVTANLYLFNVDGKKITNISEPLAVFTDIGSASIKAELEDNAPAGEYSGYLIFEIFAYRN